MQDFTKLLVWQKATALTVALERVFRGRRTRGFPGLRSQILRAAASISANIAEGCGKQSSGELVRYLLIALGSANELKNHFLLARGIGLFEAGQLEEMEAARAEIARMLWGLIRAVRANAPASR